MSDNLDQEDQDVEDLKDSLKKKVQKEHLPFDKGLSTGSTLMNLAITGRTDIGILPSKYYLLVGDSNAGKTWIAHSILAEASINTIFDDYRLIYDNGEDGALFDTEKFFGSALAERIEAPYEDENGPVFSSTVQEFYYALDDVCEHGKPFIYVLDSMDSLDSEQAEKKFDKNKKAFKKAKENETEVKESGSYGDGKAKENSAALRRIVNIELRKTNSILIVICQTRDNLGFGAQFNPKVRSGGKALTFYATAEIWTSVKKNINKNIKGKDRHIGNVCQVDIKRSRVTGRKVKVDVPIYFSHGIDDVGSLVDFLIEEGHWSKSGSSVNAKEFNFKGQKDKLIALIEENKKKENQLKLIVQDLWDEIEESCSIKRKNKYNE